MTAPRGGTLQQGELESLHPPYPRFAAVKEFIDEWMLPIAWIIGFTALGAAYNIGACALGRFFLDHFHLWNRIIPADASSLDKRAEYFAGLIASCLSIPVATVLIAALFVMEDVLDRRGKRFRPLASLSNIVILITFTEWCLLPVSGAIIHTRFYYVNPISLMGVYWFGSLVLLPVSIPVAFLIFWLLR
ncbi:hypothetical protein DL96DRAFT_1723782 [Flagelloscypha sp. PMI_526]|nr:hypothetical protein DL96DRAFT_1723782 [Flagelloscypha sp. PMI_526]